MPFYLAFELTTEPDLEELISERAARRLFQAANEEAGRYWFQNFLGRHWDEGAAAKYGYKPRTAKYMARKVKDAQRGTVLAGGRVALLAKGAMRRELKSFASVRAYPTRFTVTMYGPSYVSMRPFKSNHPNLGAEVTAVTPEEAQKLAEVGRDRMIRELDQMKTRKTYRIT